MLTVRWYGVMYVLAFWLTWVIAPYLGKRKGLHISRDEWTRIIAWGALGVLVGGRVGYVLLYDPNYFFTYPLEVFKIWHGGMSSHGGFIGAMIGVLMAVRYFSPSYEGEKEGVSIFVIADILTVPAALGLALGRIGNITNGEFGMYPLYEAIADIVIAGICYVLLRNHPLSPAYRTGRGGVVFATFLILYSVARFLLEYIRPQEWSYIYGLTRGQAYTIPLLVGGVLLWIYADKHRI